MPNVYDNRRHNLSNLIKLCNDPKTGRGGKLRVAKVAEVGHVSITTIVRKTEKRDRPGTFNLMGPEMARKIERAFMLVEGSLDLPAQITHVPEKSARQMALLDAMESRIKSGVLTDEECDIELKKIVSLYPMRDSQNYYFGHANIKRHSFIPGTTGAGKTNFMDFLAH